MPDGVPGLKNISIPELLFSDFWHRDRILKHLRIDSKQSFLGLFSKQSTLKLQWFHWLWVTFVLVRAMSSATDLPAKFLDLISECQGLAFK